MLDKIGKFSSRFRYPIIIFWVVTVILITLLAPNLGDVSISDQTSFLSAEAPSIKAALLANQYFPDQSSSGSVVLVLHSPNGKVIDNPQIPAYITDLTIWLEKEADPSGTIVSNVLSPADPALTERLTSKDGKVVIFTVGINGSMDGTESGKVLKVLKNHMETTPAGIKSYVTGGFAISHNYK